MTDREAIYAQLRQDMPTYRQTAAVPVEPIDEPLVIIEQTDFLLAEQIDAPMLVATGEGIYVRRTVAEMLGIASLALAEHDGTMQLKVVYGLRLKSIQEESFAKLYDSLVEMHPTMSEEDLREEANRFVAVPEIAGHPTGGAVDVQVLKDGVPLDMGTKNREFVPDTFVFSPFISAEARKNRDLLRSVMVGAGFAPYDGEWWHFSYGDREWAAYYDQPAAIYDQTNFKPGDEQVEANV